jgi:hypothetical protein
MGSCTCILIAACHPTIEPKGRESMENELCTRVYSGAPRIMLRTYITL